MQKLFSLYYLKPITKDLLSQIRLFIPKDEPWLWAKERAFWCLKNFFHVSLSGRKYKLSIRTSSLSLNNRNSSIENTNSKDFEIGGVFLPYVAININKNNPATLSVTSGSLILSSCLPGWLKTKWCSLDFGMIKCSCISSPSIE